MPLKPKPTLIVGHFSSVLKMFENKLDKKDVHEIL